VQVIHTVFIKNGEIENPRSRVRQHIMFLITTLSSTETQTAFKPAVSDQNFGVFQDTNLPLDSAILCVVFDCWTGWNVDTCNTLIFTIPYIILLFLLVKMGPGLLSEDYFFVPWSGCRTTRSL